MHLVLTVQIQKPWEFKIFQQCFHLHVCVWPRKNYGIPKVFVYPWFYDFHFNTEILKRTHFYRSMATKT